MKSRQQRSIDQLEALLSAQTNQKGATPLPPVASEGGDPEVRAMARLAYQLQTAPSLVPDPTFVQQVERTILTHRVRRKQTAIVQGGWPRFAERGRAWSIQLVFAVLLVCLLVSTGVTMALAAQVTNPENPLYGIKVWEQQVQLVFDTSPQQRVEVELERIHDQLNVLPRLTDASQAPKYQQALNEIMAHLDAASTMLKTLPAGPERDHLWSAFAAVKNEVRQCLYGVLGELPWGEQLTTTSVLGQLGASVPTIEQVTIVIMTQPLNQATMTVTGRDLTPTTHLIVNGHRLASRCVFHQSACVFTFPWENKTPPEMIAVLNADGTVAQTTKMVVISMNGKISSGADGKPGASGSNGKNENGTTSSNSNSNANGSRNGGSQHSTVQNPGKPTSTPVPRK
jgi:hypothetical protein